MIPLINPLLSLSLCLPAAFSTRNYNTAGRELKTQAISRFVNEHRQIGTGAKSLNQSGKHNLRHVQRNQSLALR